MKSKKIVTALVVVTVMYCNTLFAAEAKKAVKKKDTAASDQLEFNMSPAIGLSATVFNSFAFMYDFKNTFVFTVGPVFRFGAKV